MGGLEFTRVRLHDVLNRVKPKVTGCGELKTMAMIAGATDGYKVVFWRNEVFNTRLGWSTCICLRVAAGAAAATRCGIKRQRLTANARLLCSIFLEISEFSL